MNDPLPGEHTIFIVEDHRLMRSMLTRVIDADASFTVIGDAESAETAMEALDRLHPDVVLVDIGLPGISGLEMIARLRKYGSKVRFVVVSAYEDPASRQRALNVGADAFVPKSMPAELVPTLRQVLSAR